MIYHLDGINHLHEKTMQTWNGETLSLRKRHQTMSVKGSKVVSMLCFPSRSLSSCFEVKLLWMTFSLQLRAFEGWCLCRNVMLFSSQDPLGDKKRWKYLRCKIAEIISNWWHRCIFLLWKVLRKIVSIANNRVEKVAL